MSKQSSKYYMISLWALLILIVFNFTHIHAQPLSNYNFIVAGLDSFIVKSLHERPAPGLVLTSDERYDGFISFYKPHILDLCKSFFSPQTNDSLYIQVIKISSSYPKIETYFWADDSVKREIQIELIVLYPHYRGLKSESLTYSDLVGKSQIEGLESPEMPFTHGEIPEGNFFTETATPFIALGAAALSVYLFYSVRSRR